MADRTVKVKLTADTSSFSRAMSGAAKSLDGVEAKMQEAADSTERWEKVGKASTVAGAALAGGLLYAANAAKNQEIAFKSLNAVFGVNTEKMKENALASAELGLSATQYAEGAVILGAQLRNLGATETEVAVKSDELMRMAADMGAQFGDTQGAVLALSALLRGERDPIERYAIGIKEVGIEAEMAATGANKLDATLSLLNKQFENSGAAGAAIRNADTLAQQLQILKANVDNSAASIGAVLLPALASAAEKAGSFAKAIGALPEPLQQALGVIAALSAAILLLGPRVAALWPQFMKLRATLAATATQATATGAALRLLSVAGGPVMIALTGITAGLTAMAGANEEAKANAEELAGTLDSLGNNTDATRQKLTEMLTHNFSASDWEQVPFTISETIAALEEGGEAWTAYRERVRQAFDDAGRHRTSEGDLLHSLSMTLNHLERDYAEMGEAAKNAALGTEQSAIASERAAAAQLREAEAVRTLTNSVGDLISKNLALMGSQDALIGQRGRLTAAIEENGNSLVGMNQKSAANRAAMANEIGLIASVAKARYDQVALLGDEAAAASESSKVWSQHIPTLKANAAAAGYNKREIKGMIDQARKVSGTNYKMKFTADGVKAVQSDIANTERKGQQLDKSDPKVDFKSSGADKVQGEAEEQKDAVEDIPEEQKTTYQESGWSDVNRKAHDQRSAIQSIPTSHNTHYTSTGSSKENKASGGFISGPGTGTSDSIPAMLSNGEYVIRAKSVDRIGVGLLDQLNKTGKIPGFAAGGHVRGFASGGKLTADDYWYNLRKQRAEEDRRQRELQRQREENHRREQERLRKQHEAEMRRIKKQRDNAKKREQLEKQAEKARNLISWLENRTNKKGKSLYKDKYGNFKFGRMSKKDRKRYREAQRQIAAVGEYDAETARLTSAQFQETAYNGPSYVTPDYSDVDRETQKRIDTLNDRWNEYKQKADEKVAFLDRVSASFASKFDSLGMLNPDAFEAASKALDAGAKNLSSATERLNSATGAQRRDAINEIKRQREEMRRLQEEKENSAVTIENILKKARSAASQSGELAANIKALAARGLSQDMLDQIVAMGPEQGIAITKALLSGSNSQLAELNRLDRNQETRGDAIAAVLGTRYDAGIAAAGRALNVAIAAAPVTLNVDGKTLATALIEYKRQTGVSF